MIKESKDCANCAAAEQGSNGADESVKELTAEQSAYYKYCKK